MRKQTAVTTAVTISTTMVLRKTPEAYVQTSEADGRTVLVVPKSEDVDVVLGRAVERVMMTSMTLAGMAMTRTALAMERKLRPKILNDASSRSPTPSGRSTGGEGDHIRRQP